MKSRTPALILFLIAFAAIALWAQTTRQPTSNAGGSTPSASSAVNASPQSSLLRILTPLTGQKLGTNFTHVRFEVTTPAASAGTPNFLIQLDGNEPIHTTATEYDFTGLAPGVHNVTVTLVDANDTPIAGDRAMVPFSVPQLGSEPGTTTPKQSAPAVEPGRGRQQSHPQAEPRDTGEGGIAYAQPQLQNAGFAPPPSLNEDDDGKLPSASSALPLLSVIGFGVLLGGIASAMKTR